MTVTNISKQTDKTYVTDKTNATELIDGSNNTLTLTDETYITDNSDEYV